MAKAQSRRAVVIGAGIVGVCTAIDLRRRGLDVTVIDRLAPGEACSAGNAGILSAQAFIPMGMPGIHKKALRMLTDPQGPLTVRWGSIGTTAPWIWRFLRGARPELMPGVADAMKALNHSTVELHERLAREAGTPELVVLGRYLFVFRDPANADVTNGLSWKLRRERGTEIEVFDGPALREVEPELSPAYRRGVRVGPNAKTTNPLRLTQAYARLLEREGGRIVRAEVRGIVPGTPQAAVETTAGRHEGDVIVVAAGAWSRDVVRPLGFSFPLIAERGYHMTFADPGVELRHMVSEGERHFAVTGMEMGLRVAGTDELGHADDAPRWRRAEVLVHHAQELFPRLNVSKGSRWSGPRPGTPDSLPVIGPVPGHPNIILACGHGHLGLTGAPMTGRIVGAMVTGERLNIDLAPYSAERFGARARSAA